MNDTILRMEGINKSFFGVQVLNNIDFSVQKGEVHVLLGENGAGKSTLIKILSGAYTRDSGTIYINDEAVDINQPIDGLAHGISVIYQEFNLVPYLSIMDNILLGKEIRKGLFIDRQAERLQLFDQHAERFGDAEPGDRLALDDRLVRLDAADDVV